MHFHNEFGWISRIWLWKYFCFETWVAYEQLQVERTVLKVECVRLILPKFFAYLEYSWPPHIYNRIWSRSNNEMLLVLKGIQCLDGQERMEESEGSLKPVSTAQHMSIKGLGASCPISWQNAQRCPRTCQIKQSPCMSTIQQQLATECTCKGLIGAFHSIRTYFSIKACSARHHQKSQWMKEWNGTGSIHGFVHEHNREISLTLFNL